MASLCKHLLLVVAVCALSACLTHRPLASSRCDVTDMRVLFASPMTFDGKRFCGRGYLYGDDDLTAVYAQPVTQDADRYGVAIQFIAGAAARRGAPLTGNNV